MDQTTFSCMTAILDSIFLSQSNIGTKLFHFELHPFGLKPLGCLLVTLARRGGNAAKQAALRLGSRGALGKKHHAIWGCLKTGKPPKLVDSLE